MTDLSILFISGAAIAVTYYVCEAAADICMRRARSRNIVAQGWPPKHLDADGDPVTAVDTAEQEHA